MRTVKDFLLQFAADGPLRLLGGHYNWPGRPTRSAVESSAEMLKALSGRPRPDWSGNIFLNDLGGLSCQGSCPRDEGGERSDGGPDALGSCWNPRLAQAVEKAACGESGDWHLVASDLADAIRQRSLARSDHSSAAGVARLLTPPHDLPVWLSAVESFLYYRVRPRFRPLLLASELREPPPPVLFERMITNAASRMLHKLRKANDAPGLLVGETDDGRVCYWVDTGLGPIELRSERPSAEGLVAHNKCAGILAQLFYRTFREMAVGGAGSLSVFYFIPSSDRELLRRGVHAFHRLFGDVEERFGTAEVRISFAFFVNQAFDRLLCERYTIRTGDETPQPDVIGLERSGAAPCQPREREESSCRYVDHNATTPVDPRVFEKMRPFFGGCFGNASSSHEYGWEAEIAVEDARREVAELIGAKPNEIFFTSGATESNNLALTGLLGLVRLVVSSRLEHKSVLEPLAELQRRGLPVVYVGTDNQGLFMSGGCEHFRPPPGALVTLAAANNETHGLLDLERIGRACREMGALFHTDAAQALAVMPIDVQGMSIDLMSISAHKAYGPKGVGAVYIATPLHRHVTPLLLGGGQERGLRPGTVPVPLVVGFGEACALLRRERDRDVDRLQRLSEMFLDRLRQKGADFRLVGPQDLGRRRAGSLLLILLGVTAHDMHEALPGVAVSNGSACSSHAGQSHVLRALGVQPAAGKNAFRIAFGRFTQAEDVLAVADLLAGVQGRRMGAVRPSPSFLALRDEA